MVVSHEPEANAIPSGVKDIVDTLDSWPDRFPEINNKKQMLFKFLY